MAVNWTHTRLRDGPQFGLTGSTWRSKLMVGWTQIRAAVLYLQQQFGPAFTAQILIGYRM